MWGVSLFLLLGSTGLAGRRKCDEIREVEGRETAEESNLEQFLPKSPGHSHGDWKEKGEWDKGQ